MQGTAGYRAGSQRCNGQPACCTPATMLQLCNGQPEGAQQPPQAHSSPSPHKPGEGGGGRGRREMEQRGPPMSSLIQLVTDCCLTHLRRGGRAACRRGRGGAGTPMGGPRSRPAVHNLQAGKKGGAGGWIGVEGEAEAALAKGALLVAVRGAGGDSPCRS